MENKLKMALDAHNELSLITQTNWINSLSPSKHWTQEEIDRKKEKLKNFTNEDNIFEIDDFDYLEGESENFIIKEIERQGGENCGSEYWVVKKITDKRNNEEFLIRMNAYYNSWNGTDWNDIEVVEPREVSVVQYFAI